MTAAARPLPLDPAGYRSDPAAYCRDVLKVALTPAQQHVARLLVTPPYRVLVKAAHNVGKSFLAACLVNWWHDTRDPGLCLTTAPTDRQVRDILWKEVRALRDGRGGFPGPKACRLESRPDHFAHGFTARDGSRFQGHHAAAVMLVFDEAEGVEPVFWEAAETMLQGDAHAFLAIYNPTAARSPAKDAEKSGRCHVVTMSALDHPNVAAEAKGEAPPYPSAVRLGRLLEMLAQWSDPATGPGPDVVGCPDGRGGMRWFRPGPVAQARLLGVRPTAAYDAVWPEWVFDQAARRELPPTGPLQVGCDVARFGDDRTAIHARKGGVSLSHESHSGWDTQRTARRLREIATDLGRRYGHDPRRVPIAVDDCGVGGGVTDALRAEGWCACPVNASSSAPDPDEHPNLRSALWFGLADQAARGNVSFAALVPSVVSELRRQLTSPQYSLDVRGRRVVEPKDDTKKRIGRSPDDADATLLAYARVAVGPDRVAGRLGVA